MLASQRGHAEMVNLLVGACANMDEQTSQGSTALMLACKRGHLGCVDVLVSKGAEIFALDGRSRSARDTALKRSHLHLLPLLNSQVQIERMQGHIRSHRSRMLMDLFESCERHQLRFDRTLLRSLLIVQTVALQRRRRARRCEGEGAMERGGDGGGNGDGGWVG